MGTRRCHRARIGPPARQVPTARSPSRRRQPWLRCPGGADRRVRPGHAESPPRARRARRGLDRRGRGPALPREPGRCRGGHHRIRHRNPVRPPRRGHELPLRRAAPAVIPRRRPCHPWAGQRAGATATGSHHAYRYGEAGRARRHSHKPFSQSCSTAFTTQSPVVCDARLTRLVREIPAPTPNDRNIDVSK
ncbi:Uncharacterised protein [Mycobacteroides abscessus subsp. abscessus]|nr:Uncharacterised protein [Mycobacteroides abscessus subsp. abscessus]